MRRLFWPIVCCALLAAAYVAGAYSFALDLWPIHALRNFKRDAVGQAQVEAQFDRFGRLIAWTGKQEIACPAQDARTAVILFIGQSIQSNDAGQRYVSTHGDQVVGWFDGHCSIAASPLLGASGDKGEPLTQVGNELIASGLFDRVILVPSSIGGTQIARWANGGDLQGMLGDVLDGLKSHYRLTHIVWHQGEDDFNQRTSTAAYTQQFNTLVDLIRRKGVDAPIFVSITSRCDDDSKWTPDNPVTIAQRALPDAARGLYAGVDTDALLQPIDRYDNCHLGSSGILKYASALVDVLRWAR